MIIGSNSTPQIHRMCIPRRRTKLQKSAQKECQTKCLSITIPHTTARQSGWPGKACNTGDLGGAKTFSDFPTNLICYSQIS